MNKQSFLTLITRYVEFAASTLAGTAVDMLVLWLCSDYLFQGTYWGENIVSPCISFECAVFTNFLFAYYGVWRERISNYNARSFFRHWAGYNLSCIGAFLVKLGILLLVQYLSQWDVLICNMIALCFSGLLNFFLNERVVFSAKRYNKKNGN